MQYSFSLRNGKRNRRTPGYRYPALTAFAVATAQAPLTMTGWLSPYTRFRVPTVSEEGFQCHRLRRPLSANLG